LSGHGEGASAESGAETRGAEVAAATGDEARRADRWIWGLWIGVALFSVAVLPFASRFGDVAKAIAQFCGFGI